LSTLELDPSTMRCLAAVMQVTSSSYADALTGVLTEE
jgi:hypothetical protein